MTITTTVADDQLPAILIWWLAKLIDQRGAR
jgi:hypothetical protein